MIHSLQLSFFRSHRDVSIQFEGGLHVVRGQNGAGKTNILEAIYLLLNGRTFDGRPPAACITDEATDMAVMGNVGTRYFGITASREAKFPSFVVDRKKVTRPFYFQHIGHRAVFFSNQELNVIYQEPQLRRDFLDEHLDLADPTFGPLRADYTKVVRSRNKLLAMVAEHRADPADLEFWDAKVATLGACYGAARRSLVDWLFQRLPLADTVLAQQGLAVEYISKIPRDEEAASWILSYLRQNRDRDILLGRTCVGPHLDDLALFAGATREPIAQRLSRGECKSAFLALKFLAVAFVEEKNPGRETIYLLDDLFSELDPRRCRWALDAVEQKQVFVTVQDGVMPDLKRKSIITDL